MTQPTQTPLSQPHYVLDRDVGRIFVAQMLGLANSPGRMKIETEKMVLLVVKQADDTVELALKDSQDNWFHFIFKDLLDFIQRLRYSEGILVAALRFFTYTSAFPDIYPTALINISQAEIFAKLNWDGTGEEVPLPTL